MNTKVKANKEGTLKTCADCQTSCCDDQKVQEWANEYLAYHAPIKKRLLKLEIRIKFLNDRVEFKNCSDGQRCKFLKIATSNRPDPRPIDCKIFPYVVDWDTINFDKKTVKLYYWDKTCPLVKSNSIPKKFKKEVEKIIKRDFAVLFYGTKFKVVFIGKSYDWKNDARYV